jgi:phosphocarrier protein
VVANQLGLHARPAGVLAQEAQKFASEIYLDCQGQKVDAKSILDVLTLAAGQGARLELKASGEDAEAALDRIETLFKERFGEGK